MPGKIPPRPSGSNEEFTFFQWVWDELTKRYVNSATVKISESDREISFHAAPAGNGGTNLLQCVVTSLFQTNYMGVTQYNSTTGQTIGSEFLCAKAHAAQVPAQEIIDGITIIYSYTDDNTRQAAAQGFATETQKCHPRYIPFPAPDGTAVNQILLSVERVQGGSLMTASDEAHFGQPINFIELSPREWALASTS
jgi:hypothetical protein